MINSTIITKLRLFIQQQVHRHQRLGSRADYRPVPSPVQNHPAITSYEECHRARQARTTVLDADSRRARRAARVASIIPSTITRLVIIRRPIEGSPVARQPGLLWSALVVATARADVDPPITVRFCEECRHAAGTLVWRLAAGDCQRVPRARRAASIVQGATAASSQLPTCRTTSPGYQLDLTALAALEDQIA